MESKLSKTGNASNLLDQLISTFSVYHPISEELRTDLGLLLKINRLKKDQFLIKQGEYCTHFYFLLKGILVSTTKTDHKELTNFIIADGDFVTSISGMYGYKPSRESIFAIEDSLLVSLHSNDILEFYKQYPEMNIIMRCLMERCFQEAHERSNMMRLGTAKEKYLYLVEVISDHLARIPLVYQANYLDIRPETLQRINRELYEENDEMQFSKLTTKLDLYINKHSDFLKTTITVKELADALEIRVHQLNYLIRAKYKKSFTQFINFLKIDFVKKRFETTTDWKQLTLEGIGKEAGFKSRSVFFSEFKKQTGTTPGNYIRKLNKR